MTKKRLLVYAALILVFTIACIGKIMPSLMAEAVYASPAEIGTATLADAGDTVFIRMAEFTFGEGDDEEKIVAPGFTVATAATGSDPAEGIDLSVLTPITPENPLTGELDKNIYVCGGNLNDLYLGDLRLTEGRKIYTDGSGLNFLGGKLNVPAIETTGFIAIGSADVTVNSDLTGFQGIVLFVSHSNDVHVKGFDTPAYLTVNGNVSNKSQYNSAAIDVIYGSGMTVTGDVYTEYPVVIHSSTDYGKSTFNVGGSLTVKNSPYWGFQLVYADAVIGGDVKVDYYVQLNNSSALQAKSVTATQLAANTNSAFSIEENVTLSSWLDLSSSSAPQSYSVGGKLKCGIFNIVGPGAGDKCSLYVGGDIEAGQFYLRNTVLDADGDLKKTDGGVFHCEASGIDVAGNVSGTNFELGSCKATIHGNVTVSSSEWGCSIKNSTLLIEGDAAMFKLNPLGGSTVSIEGTLTNSGLLSLNDNSKLILKSDFNSTDNVGVNQGSNLVAEKNLTTNGLISLNGSSVVTVGGDFTANNDLNLEQGTKLVAEKNLTNNRPLSTRGGIITVGGDYTANDQAGIGRASSFTVEGNMISNAGLVNVREGSNLLVKKDFTITERGNGFDSQDSGTVVTVNGDFNYNGGNLCNANQSGVFNVLGDFTGNGFFGVINGGQLNVTGDFTSSHGLWPNRGGVVTIGGNAECGPNMEAVNGSSVTIGGNLHANYIGAINDPRNNNNPSTVIVGRDAVCDYSFNTFEGSTMDIGGDFTYNSANQSLEGVLTVGGDLNNLASRESVFDNKGLFVSGLLDVDGDVNLNNLILNYNDEDENLNVAGRINAYRQTDVIKAEDGEYVIEGENVTQKHPDDSSYFYSVPYNQQTADLTINGETYAINVRDHDPKSFEPVKVTSTYAVNYELNGGEFREDAVIEYSYYPEIGLELPTEKDFKSNGFIFEAWHDSADFEGDPITEIPAGSTGDKTVYAKMKECDHTESTAQPDCENSAVCSICGKEIPALGHTWNEPDWNWDDVEHPQYSTTCSACPAAKSGEADSVESVYTDPTVEADGYTTYTAAVTLDGQSFSNNHIVVDEGSQLVEYTATFVADGKTIKEDKFTIKTVSLDEPAVPAKEGYTGKWSDYTLGEADITITAEYTAIEYTATFTADGKTVKEEKFTVETEKLDEPAVPAKTGYTGKWSAYTLGAADIEIKAVYTANEYTITYVVDGEKTEVKYAYGAAVSKPADPSKKDFIFDGWDKNIPVTMPAENLTVTALFSPIPEIDFSADKLTLEETRLYGMDNGFSVKGDIPKGAKIEWYVNGEKAGEGRNFIVTEPKEDYTVQAKLVDSQGNVLSETDEANIDINTGFFARLYWFFCSFIQRIIDTVKGAAA